MTAAPGERARTFPTSTGKKNRAGQTDVELDRLWLLRRLWAAIAES